MFLTNKLCLTPLWLPDSSVYGISKARIQSGLQFPSPGDLSNSRIEPMSPTLPALSGRFFTVEPPGKLAIPLLGIFPEGKKNINLRRYMNSYTGFPRWLNGKETACRYMRYKRHGFDPWVRKIFCRRECQPTPVFLPGEFHGHRSCNPWGCNQPLLSMHACTCTPMLVEALFTKEKT